MVNEPGLLSSKETRTWGSARAPSKNPPPLYDCTGKEKEKEKMGEEKGRQRDAGRIVSWDGASIAAYIRS